MSDNLNIWNRLGRTDPGHTKEFKRGGGFTGTAIKPIYTQQKMTEVFGPCGIGWGFTEPQFQIVPGSNNEVLVYCWLTLWYVTDGARSAPIPGVGGDKIITHIKANEKYNRPERWESDDEAFKKAFTDAIGNAMKHIGMSADVHMGRFEDSKYVSEIRREIAEEEQQNTRAAAPPADHSTAYKVALLSMKMSRSKADLREWWESNWDRLKETLPEDEGRLLIGERNTLGFTLPEFAEVAA